jgi:hypothetical protein
MAAMTFFISDKALKHPSANPATLRRIDHSESAVSSSKLLK